MLAELAPGVRFQWVDDRRFLGIVRTDVAGFVGIAARGPLHTPVRVESWTQFVSAFGSHISQGYLAYAVEGFFANGGRVCWVVRAADPDGARAAFLELEEIGQRSRLRFEASSPGVWGRGVSVALAPTSGDRFSLTLRLPTGEQEFWPDLTTAVASLDLRDREGRPTLRLAAYHPDIWRHDVSVEVGADGTPEDPRFRLRLDLQPRAFDDVTNEEEDIFQAGREQHQDILARLDFQPLVFDHLSMRPGDERYAPAVLGKIDPANQLVAATDLFSSSPCPANTPAPGAPNLRFRIGRLERELRYVHRVLNHPRRGSSLVRVERRIEDDEDEAGAAPRAEDHLPRLAGLGRLEHGAEGLETLEPYHLSGRDLPAGVPPDTVWGLEALASVDQVAIVAIPDASPKEGFAEDPGETALRCHVLHQAPPAIDFERPFAPHFDELQILRLQNALIDHCERLRDRVAMLDPLPYQVTAQQVIDWRTSFDTSFAALYYPWLGVPDPLRLTGLLRRVPPSGHVAGILARSDLRHGVHKPPANEVVEGARDAAVTVGEIGHGDLNNAQINLIRSYAGRGLRLMGARTLSSDSELIYLNVRRLLTMIVEALDQGLQRTVMEPSDARLWSVVEREVASFLNRLWRRGWLDGASVEEAYFVHCDATTNPPEEVEAGRLICVIGVRPPWPAEFIVVRLGRSEGSLDILEEKGDRDG